MHLDRTKYSQVPIEQCCGNTWVVEEVDDVQHAWIGEIAKNGSGRVSRVGYPTGLRHRTRSKKRRVKRSGKPLPLPQGNRYRHRKIRKQSSKFRSEPFGLGVRLRIKHKFHLSALAHIIKRPEFMAIIHILI